MNKVLAEKRIVIAGSRKTDEMSKLIEIQGGIPVVRSLQGMLVFDNQEMDTELKRFLEDRVDWVILLTGIGAEMLLQTAERLNRTEEFLTKLKQAKVAARGYKTAAFLKKYGIKPVAVDEDGTTESLMQALENHSFISQRVALQLHGEPENKLLAYFKQFNCQVQKLLPYRHVEPSAETLESLVYEIEKGKVDVVCFTTGVQVRYLFEYAKRMGQQDSLKLAFQQNVLAAAVGKVTAAALKEEGIERMLVPRLERMGAMIVELQKYYSNL